MVRYGSDDQYAATEPVTEGAIKTFRSSSESAQLRTEKPLPHRPRDSLLERSHAGSSLVAEKQPVKRAQHWTYPMYMTTLTIVGLGCALGHHSYYRALQGRVAGSPSRQNWTVIFGTAFAFLVVSCLRATCGIAYKQYIWIIFRRKSLRLSILDKLFTATADPFAFLSYGFIRNAKLAFVIALTCWFVAFMRSTGIGSMCNFMGPA